MKRRSRPLENIRRFFEKRPEPAPPRGNRRGQGFRLHTPAQPGKIRTRIAAAAKQASLWGAGGIAVLTVVALALRVTPDFALLVAAMLALGGLVLFDTLGRRRWEREAAAKLDDLCARHDRLVREAARNRSDIALLKDGLGRLAAGLEEERAKLPGGSAEAALIETVAARLGDLGDRPRAMLETPYDRDILELEMAPPPPRPEPLGGLEGALSADPDQYTDSVVAELLRHAVRNDRVDLFMQPVVALPQRRPVMYEIYARIRAGAGTYIPAQRYGALARRDNLQAAIDGLMLARFLDLVGGRGGEGKTVWLLNVSAAALNDRGFMNELAAFLSRNHKVADRLVFELTQEELEEQGDSLAPLIGGLAKLGCRFSMDGVRARTVNIARLKSLHIRYVKFDAAWLLYESREQGGFSRVTRMKKQLESVGIDLVVERVESEEMLRELLDFGIDYGQGYLFGKPDHRAAYPEARAAA